MSCIYYIAILRVTLGYRKPFACSYVRPDALSWLAVLVGGQRSTRTLLWNSKLAHWISTGEGDDSYPRDSMRRFLHCQLNCTEERGYIITYTYFCPLPPPPPPPHDIRRKTMYAAHKISASQPQLLPWWSTLQLPCCALEEIVIPTVIGGASAISRSITEIWLSVHRPKTGRASTLASALPAISCNALHISTAPTRHTRTSANFIVKLTDVCWQCCRFCETKTGSSLSETSVSTAAWLYRGLYTVPCSKS